jgi:hypothetical protein
VYVCLQFCSSANKSFLAAINTDADTLLHKYQEMAAAALKSSWKSFLFYKSSLFVSSIVTLRLQIEFKIIQRLFQRVHRLPVEFSFAKYTSYLFKVRVQLHSLLNICSL